LLWTVAIDILFGFDY